MNTLDKTLLTNNGKELHKIYEEEARKLQENEFKLNLLQKLSIDDFPSDLAVESKVNIEKALLSVQIRDHICLDNGQKLLGMVNTSKREDQIIIAPCAILGLHDFNVGLIALSYMEKKLIRERIVHMISLEKKKIDQKQKPQTLNELIQSQKKFIELQKENFAMTETLADLKRQELELMKEVAEEFVSSAQKNLVQGIFDDAKIVNLQLKSSTQVVQDSEMSRTGHAKKAFTEISSYVDELLQEKQLACGNNTK